MAVNEMEAIKFNLQRQNEQANALIQVIEKVEQIETNVNKKYAEVKEIVDEVKDRVTIEYEDQQILKSIVGSRARKLSNEYYGNSKKFGAEIRELTGYAMRYQWKLLKDYFRVTRYTSIRHVDRDRAKEFLEGIVIEKSFFADYEQWKYQRAKKRERELKQLESEGK